MNILKKPAVALIVSIVLIVSSTFISADIKLGKECDGVCIGFYEGIDHDGYVHKSIYSQLDNLCGAVSGLMTIGAQHQMDTAELSGINGELIDLLKAKDTGFGKAYSLYSSVADSAERLGAELAAQKLSDREKKGLETYMSTIRGAQSVIADAGYNESVGRFTDGLDFLADFFMNATDTQLPEMFE